MKKSKKTANNTANTWFDSENARLILLCATLGIFGAHKFAQHKTFQGILFILLDLTIFGFLITLIWSFLDLIFLTAKPANKPGNIILGSVFILVGISASAFSGGANLLLENKVGTTLTPQEEFVFEKDMKCWPAQDITSMATTQKVDLIVGNDIITVPVKTNSKTINVYEGYWAYNMPLEHSTNPQDKFIITINKDTNIVHITGKLDGIHTTFECE
jgi:TM2 domain-containing membrane protein YozV